jgi:cytochrome c oxidase assembly protein subunit 15
VTSPRWRAAAVEPAARAFDRVAGSLSLLAFASIYLQLVLGAVMRHMDAGLAIPDFPLAFGRLVPPHWSTQIALHYAHRVWALAVTAAVVALAVRALRVSGGGALAAPARFLLLLLPVQIALGGLTVLSLKNPAVATAHLAVGALLLATSLVLAIRVWRPEIEARAAWRRTMPDASPAGAPLLGS